MREGCPNRLCQAAPGRILFRSRSLERSRHAGCRQSRLGEGLRDTRLTPDEQYSHVSLWALLAAPLVIGGDLSVIDEFTLNLLCNNEVIAVDQDPLGKQAGCLWEDEVLQVWGRPLSDGSHAAGIFNMGEKAMEVNVSQILDKAGYEDVKSCRDLWRQTDCPSTFTIPSHGVLLVKFL